MSLLHPTPPRRPSLSHCTSTPAKPAEDDDVRVFGVTGAQLAVARLRLVELSSEAKRRLHWFDWHVAHGQNVSRTCRHFDISRQTFYRWWKRYDPSDLSTLEDRSSCPKHRRQCTWTTDEILAVQRLRERFPRWGKEKLWRLLERSGLVLAVSRIGRILRYLKRSGKLKEPLVRSLVRRRRWQRPYATRKPRDYLASQPGDIVQVDTVDLRLGGNTTFKQFTAVDVTSRWSVASLASNATARLAVRALDAIQERMPFPVRAIQVDGGSEFMADFEGACKERGIRLFTLPPHSPKLNGRVERANRTYREEFYDCSSADLTVSALGRDLHRFERVYNHIRPHRALDYLTPAEFLRANYPMEV